MTRENQNFEIYSEDSIELECQVTSDQDFDLNNGTIEWTLSDIKEKPPEIEKLPIDKTATTFTIELTTSDTEDLSGTYYHQAQFIGMDNEKNTVMTGQILVK